MLLLFFLTILRGAAAVVLVMAALVGGSGSDVSGSDQANIRKFLENNFCKSFETASSRILNLLTSPPPGPARKKPSEESKFNT